MTDFRLRAEGQIVAGTSDDNRLRAFADIHNYASLYTKDTPLVIEVRQDGEWRKLYADDEWRG